MKVLSIRQPWAWLIVTGKKKVENRTWPTKFRGRFLVHAGKSIDKEALRFLKMTTGIEFPDKFHTGCVIGSVEIFDCVTSCGSQWFEGPYGFLLRDAQQMHPRPMKGRLGFFESPIDFGDVLRSDQ